MFCTECGQQMANEAKFCAYCGTRRSIPPAGGEAATASPRMEPPVVTPPVAPRTTVRSTAEIMPMRVQRPSAAPPRVTEAGPVEADEQQGEAAWPEEDHAAPSLFTQPVAPVARETTPQRTAPAYNPPPQAYSPPPPTPADRYSSVPFAAGSGVPEVAAERRRVSPVLIVAIVVALIALGGIFWMLRSSMSASSKAAQTVGITIYPTSAKVVAGKSADFAATITGAPTSEVTWKVEEGGGCRTGPDARSVLEGR